MSEIPKPIDKKAFAQKTVNALGVVAGIALAIPGSPAVQPTTPEKTVQVDTAKTGGEKAPLSAKEKQKHELGTYLNSEDRNDKLEGLTDTLGRRIMKAARSGKLGPFDAYNPKTDEWASRSPKTSGWVYYQHNPQYGGTDTQYMLTVYRKSDGVYDLDKGVKSVIIDPDSDEKGSMGVEFNAPKEGILGSGSEVYAVTVINEHEFSHRDKNDTTTKWYDMVADPYNTTVNSVEEAAAVEEEAVDIANKLLEKDHVS